MNIESKPSESEVLAIALYNLKDILDISNNDLGEIIGVHRNTLSRSLSNKKIAVKSKEEQHRTSYSQKDFWIENTFPSPAT